LREKWAFSEFYRLELKLLQWQKLIAARFFFAGNDLVQSGIQTGAGI